MDINTILTAGYLLVAVYGQPEGSREIVRYAGVQTLHADGSATLRIQETGKDEKRDGAATHQTVTYRDEVYPFFITRHFVRWDDCDVVETWIDIRHDEPGPVKLIKMDSFAAVIPGDKAKKDKKKQGKPQRIRVTTLAGKWGEEAGVCESELAPGQTLATSSREGIHNAWESNPAMMLSFGDATETDGEVLGVALEWTGTSAKSVRREWNGRTKVFIGVENETGPYTLDPGVTLTTPKALVVLSKSGKGEVSRQYHRWARRHLMPHGDDLHAVLLNSWEGSYFSFTEQTLTDMMDGVKEMGGEMFVLDDGWFGRGEFARDEKNKATAGLGDWYVNDVKLPHGLGWLADQAKARGLKFGIWVEPEMVNSRSERATKHPEWITQEPKRKPVYGRGGNQLVLDMANPALRDDLFAQIDATYAAMPDLAFVKWDANTPLSNPGSTLLPPDRQPNIWFDYTKGLYDLLARFQAKRPQVMVQACASGGGHMDFGFLRYADEFWTSDVTDPCKRIFIQWGASQFYPASAMACHVTASPNHQTKRETPLSYRFDVAMCGRLGFELHPKDLKPEELAYAKQRVAQYKEIRPVVQRGDLYRLVSPYENPYAALMYVSEDKSRAVVFTLGLDKEIDISSRLPLQGLDPRRAYCVDGAEAVSGAALMKEGLAFSLKGKYASKVFVLSADGKAKFAPDPIVFNTPAADEKGSMVLGNGEVGATAWLGADGVLHTVLQNSDSWNEGGRHVKTGAIDYDTKAPVDAGSYRQELSMARGEFEAEWKSGGETVSVRYRVQHGTDSIAVCEVRGAPKAEAKVVNWRLYPGGSKEFGVGENGLGIRFCEGQFQKNVENMKFTIGADRLVPGGWCHVNRNETVAELMKVYDYYQATGDLGKTDLLSDRAFGGITRRMAGRTDDSSVLFISAITCLHPCRDESEWQRLTNEMLDRDGWTPDGEDAKRAAHIAAWVKFWDRSHIDVTPSVRASQPAERSRYDFKCNNKLPICFGVNPRGGDRFLGKFAFAEVEFDGNKAYSGVPKVGDAVARDKDARCPGSFSLSCRFTTPDAAKPQRLIDNITPGTADGFLVDLLNGHVRMIVGKNIVIHSAMLPSGREVAVEAVVPRTGPMRIEVDGKCETFNPGAATVADECAAVTRAYAAQRYTTACAGLGRLPIRFNGSLFTVSYKDDPDYRRWGNGYWWQNTRLPYYPMFAAGDLDMLQPLFRMYLGLLDFNMKRTRKYLGHGGAYFPECVQPWGDHFMGSYGPECEWKDRKDKLQHHPCHKYEWVGQLEISLMLLYYQAYTQDVAWFRKNALPSIREYVCYFDEHYKLDGNGRYHMWPAQAVETWQDCTNPMPEIAGVTRVTDLLLALPDEALEAGDRELFSKIRSRVPDLPTRRLEDGSTVFAPGGKFDRHRNVETPELYCVFPFRLCSFEKPNADVGLRTYPVRFHKHYRGWAQDELNAAYLGLADEAAEHLAARVLGNSAAGFRWPAYWGPNFDWRPDQCAGGNIQNTLQSMMLQFEGRKIYLMPAWPKEWNCDFKLQAPYNTTVEGRVENGELKDLVVTPASRRADVTVFAKGT